MNYGLDELRSLLFEDGEDLELKLTSPETSFAEWLDSGCLTEPETVIALGLLFKLCISMDSKSTGHLLLEVSRCTGFWQASVRQLLLKRNKGNNDFESRLIPKLIIRILQEIFIYEPESISNISFSYCILRDTQNLLESLNDTDNTKSLLDVVERFKLLKTENLSSRKSLMRKPSSDEKRAAKPELGTVEQRLRKLETSIKTLFENIKARSDKESLQHRLKMLEIRFTKLLLVLLERQNEKSVSGVPAVTKKDQKISPGLELESLQLDIRRKENLLIEKDERHCNLQMEKDQGLLLEQRNAGIETGWVKEEVRNEVYNQSEVERNAHVFSHISSSKSRNGEVELHENVCACYPKDRQLCSLEDTILVYRLKDKQEICPSLLKRGKLYCRAQVADISDGMNCVTYTMCLVASDQVNWAETRNLLAGSVVCLSRDGFHSFCFVTITKRLPLSGTSKNCRLTVVPLIQKAPRLKILYFYDILEIGCFRESCKHLIRKLKWFCSKSFPLGENLLDLEGCDMLPAYLSTLSSHRLTTLHNPSSSNFCAEDKERKSFNVSDLVPVEENTLNFDNYQLKAFRLALTNRIALIQGAPGTGKTHVGLKIVQWFVDLRYMALRYIQSPILVICYSQNALNHFIRQVSMFTSKIYVLGTENKVIQAIPCSPNQSKVVSLDPPQQQTRDRDRRQTKKMTTAEGNKSDHGSSNLLTGIHSDEERKDDSIDNFARRNDFFTLGSIINPGRRKIQINLNDGRNRIKKLKNLILAAKIHPLSSEVIEHIVSHKYKEQLMRHKLKLEGDVRRKKLLEKVKNWLCISPQYRSAYEENVLFRECIVKEGLEQMSRDQNHNNTDEEVEMANTKTEGDELLDWLLTLLRGPLQEMHHPEVTRYSEKINLSLLKGSGNGSEATSPSLKQNAFQNTAAIDVFENAASKICETSFSKADEMDVVNIWEIDLVRRWMLFSAWRRNSVNLLEEEMCGEIQKCKCNERKMETERINDLSNKLRKTDVIAVTAADVVRHWELLEKTAPCTVVVEEADRVLESPIMTSLPSSTDHLILIGDNELSTYSLHSKSSNINKYIEKPYSPLFERLVKGGVPLQKLVTQYRMVPSISKLLLALGVYKKFENDASVLRFVATKGVRENVFFISHEESGTVDETRKCCINKHEAAFLVEFCLYLLQQGHSASEITILSTCFGQTTLLKGLMLSRNVKGVNVTTVENFRGEESEIILLSLVASDGTDLKSSLESIDFVCTALTRAKRALYGIGNFTFLASKCLFWHKIKEKLRNKGLIGKQLCLQCQKHPSAFPTVASEADIERVRNGGCKEGCRTLACDKSVEYDGDNEDENGVDDDEKLPSEEISSNDDSSCVETVICRSSLRGSNNLKGSVNEKTLCGMDCSLDLKHEDCLEPVLLYCGHEAPCNVDVSTYQCEEFCLHVPPCEHEVTIECYRKLKHTYRCNKTEVIPSPCGHEVKISCESYLMAFSNEEMAQRLCQEKCEAILRCNHQCPGTCGKCFRGQIHEMCEIEKDISSLCGHSRTWKCGGNLPVCEERCFFYCEHSRCLNQCDYPCTKCSRPCEWKCDHLKCTRLCGDPCDRPPCDLPCPKRLVCGHPCLGFCGEPCPPVCFQCRLIENLYQPCNDNDGSTNRYVLLEDCAHIIERNTLEQWLDTSLFGPTCPMCRRRIRKNTRFGNAIKQWILESRAPVIAEGFVDLPLGCSHFQNRTIGDAVSRYILRKAKRIITDRIIESELSTSDMIAINKVIYSMLIVSWALEILSHFCTEQEMARAVYDMKSLETWQWANLMSTIGPQQMEEMRRVTRRFSLLAFLVSLRGRVWRAKGEYQHALQRLNAAGFGPRDEEIVLRQVETCCRKEMISREYFCFFSELDEL